MKGDIIVYTKIDEESGTEVVVHSMTVVSTDNKDFENICVFGKGGIEPAPYKILNKDAWKSNKVGGVGYFIFRKAEEDKKLLSQEEIDLRKKTTSDFKSLIRTLVEGYNL
jgi:hypothetical protein